ncbi:hypothetical protein [Staphylococcus shinii]|uniref:hypothetical protein n=1 Tax=Staphylococcus shinii TaxID=2912228 RepID=UPI003F8293E2
MKTFKFTKKFLSESWYILVNFVVAVVIICLFKFWNISVSKFVFKNASETDLISLDLALVTPVLSLVFILLFGLLVDFFVNEVEINVLPSNEEDVEVKLPAPTVESNEYQTIYIEIKLKRKIENKKMVKIIIPYWYSFQPKKNQNIIYQEDGNFLINLANIKNTDNSGRYAAKIECYVISNDSGREKNKINFERESKSLILNDSSITFRQLEGDGKL